MREEFDGGEDRKTGTAARAGGEGGLVMVVHEVTHLFLNSPATNFSVHAKHEWRRRPG